MDRSEIIDDLKGVVTRERATKVAAALWDKGWRKIDAVTIDAIGNVTDLARSEGAGPVIVGSIIVIDELTDSLKEEHP